MVYLDEQAKFAAEMNTPHFRFKPSLMRLRDGRMLAIIGNVDDLDNAIVGVGNSAEEALKLFDETFTYGVPLHVAKYLAERETDLEEGKKPQPFPKTDTSKNETKSPVAEHRSNPTPKAPRRRKNKSGNS
jgi:hypothetical protein